jgi:H+-translocating NAD(P) transhydrogenase subunit alpha
VLVLGAGVAGLQAIATARRLGAAVTGYDVRPAALEQIRSLGAKALEETVEAEAEGGTPAPFVASEQEHQLAFLAHHVPVRRGHHHGPDPRQAGPRLVTETWSPPCVPAR